MTIKIKKVMQSYQLPPDQIHKLSILQERLNSNNTNHNPISKNALISEALDLLFKKYKL
jgi:hypothetical protein